MYYSYEYRAESHCLRVTQWPVRPPGNCVVEAQNDVEGIRRCQDDAEDGVGRVPAFMLRGVGDLIELPA